jgi:hypothetical protein
MEAELRLSIQIQGMIKSKTRTIKRNVKRLDAIAKLKKIILK